jgi:signal transduction histidine kinase
MSRLRYSPLSVVLTLAITAGMSWAFHGEVRRDFLVTGVVCAVVVEFVVAQITAAHRRALGEANRLLDRRVRERTSDLERANLALRREVQERREVEQQLIDAERLAVAGGVAAGVCHEIKNPLSAVFGNVELAQELLEERGADREVQNLLSEAIEAARQVAAVTGDLQTLARTGTESSVVMDLAQSVDSAVRLASPYLRANCRVVVEIPEGTQVLAAPSRVVQVLLNLLINAANASRPDGPNTVTIRSGPSPDGMVAVEVRDTGIGMDEVVQQRLFDPFFTTRRSSGGTGLGLYLCRTIVASYGGTISFRSAPEEGSTFRFTVPAAP